MFIGVIAPFTRMVQCNQTHFFTGFTKKAPVIGQRNFFFGSFSTTLIIIPSSSRILFRHYNLDAQKDNTESTFDSNSWIRELLPVWSAGGISFISWSIVFSKFSIVISYSWSVENNETFSWLYCWRQRTIKSSFCWTIVSKEEILFTISLSLSYVIAVK